MRNSKNTTWGKALATEVLVVMLLVSLFAVGVEGERGATKINNDWIVTSTEIRSNETIIVNGNLIIQSDGKLTLNNVTLIMNCSYTSEYDIEVQSGGEMYIYNGSNITSANPDYHYMFWVKRGSKFEMRNSETHNCGWVPSGTTPHGGLVIDTEGAIIDFSKFSDNYYGIHLNSASNTTITNCCMSSNYCGIFISPPTHNNSICGCIVFNNSRYGIYISNSLNNTLKNNQVWKSGENILVSGYEKEHFNNSIDTSNMIHGKPAYYFFDLKNTTIQNLDAGHITLAWCENVTLENCSVTDGDCIYVICTTNSTILNCNSSRNNYNWYGICLAYSSNNYITKCKISNACYGIMLGPSSCNVISESNILKNFYGVISVKGYSNTIRNCNISNNYYYGIYWEYFANNNSAYHNNFINNVIEAYPYQAYDKCTNFWDNGYPNGGNYWSDYKGKDLYSGSNQDQPGSDCIGDTPYNISGGSNKDRYPLWYPTDQMPNQSPITNFTYSPTAPTINDIIQFNDLSTDSDDYIISWFWNFGDGSTSILQNPAHQYSSPGNYTVTLTVTDNDGTSDSCSYVVTVSSVNQPPVANFTYSPASPTDMDIIQFIDTSIDLDGTIVNWAWNFGDGNTSTLKNPTHQYATAGDYTVTLTVTDNDGATDTCVYVITISAANQPPTAVTLSEPVDITTGSMTLAWSENTDSDFAKYEIYESGSPGILGSLIESITVRAVTTFVRTGLSPDTTYYFTVRMVDTGSLYNDSNQVSGTTLKENEQPSAYIDSISPNPANQNEPVTFTGHGTDTDGSIVAYSWSSSIDGFLSDLESFSTSTLSVGTHTIYFKIQDNNGMWSSEVTETLVINPVNQPPTAVTLYDPTEITTNSMTLTWIQNTDDDFAKYEIYQSTLEGALGALIYTITEQTTTSYTVPDLSQDTTYYFTVRVVDTGDLYSDSNQVSGKTLKENQPPTAYIDSISPNPATQGETVTFTGHGTDEDGSIVAYNWRSSIDGQLCTSASFDMSSLSVGTHTISFKVKDNNDTWAEEVTDVLIISAVNQPPIASFTYYQGIDVVNSDNITLTLRVAGDKWHAVNMTVLENETAIGFVNVEREPGSPDEQVKAVSVKINSSRQYLIVLEYSSLDSGANPAWITVEYIGITKTIKFVFNAPPEENQEATLDLDKILDDMIKSHGLVKFDASSSYDIDGSITNYTWNFGDGMVCYGKIVYHNYVDGNYTVTLTVKDNDNAVNSTSATITVTIPRHILPYPNPFPDPRPKPVIITKISNNGNQVTPSQSFSGPRKRS